MSQKQSIEDRVKANLVEVLGVDLEKITSQSDIADDLGADSLDMVELAMSFEEEFDIEIPDDTEEPLITVADVVAFITKRSA